MTSHSLPVHVRYSQSRFKLPVVTHVQLTMRFLTFMYWPIDLLALSIRVWMRVLFFFMPSLRTLISRFVDLPQPASLDEPPAEVTIKSHDLNIDSEWRATLRRSQSAPTLQLKSIRDDQSDISSAASADTLPLALQLLPEPSEDHSPDNTSEAFTSSNEHARHEQENVDDADELFCVDQRYSSSSTLTASHKTRTSSENSVSYLFTSSFNARRCTYSPVLESPKYMRMSKSSYHIEMSECLADRKSPNSVNSSFLIISDDELN